MSLPPNMPPVPRDAEEASFTEMMPLKSSKISMKRSALLYVAIAAALMSVFGFKILDDLSAAYQAHNADQFLKAYNIVVQVTIFAVLMLVQALLYFYAKPQKALWVYMIPFVLTYVLMGSPLWDYYYLPFDKILPGHIPDLSKGEPADTFPLSLIHAFFGPGLREELLKAFFPLFAAWLTFRAMKNPAAPRNTWIERIRLTGPLDGVMMGIFAGGGFTLHETGGQYVLGAMITQAQQTGDLTYGATFGLTLLIPRVIEGLSGHMGYAAIFGYFIGLAVIRPKSKWKLIGMGYVAAALLHGAWDGMSMFGYPVLYTIAVLVTILAVGVLLKARQLESLVTGRMVETTGSIVVERPVPMMPVSAAPAPRAPFSRPPVAPPVPMPQAPTGPLMLDIGGLRIPLRGGEKLDLGIEPALAGRGAGVVGTIVPHPTRADVLGLKNAGSAPWTAYLRDGTSQIIDGNKNIRLAPGVRIDFGNGLSGSVVPAM